MPDTVDAAPAFTETAKLLAEVNQDTANILVEAFNSAARETNAHNGEAMWAIALLQARVLAQADMGDVQTWTANRFYEMVRLALPAMIVAVERGRRAATGEQPFDA